MIRHTLELICFLVSAARVVVLPGLPISIQPLDDGIVVACMSPASVCFIDDSSIVSSIPFMEVAESRDLCLWDGTLVASDFAAGEIITGDRSISVPGNPDGICEVNWDSSSVSQLAVALFNPGSILLMNHDGSFSTLIEMPGVKSLFPCDVDNDGDIDIFASGCGSGVVVVENRNSVPVIHEVGTIQSGVKRCFANDMDSDGNIDIAGIACAAGGAGWWRNPGRLDAEWHYQEIDGSLEGPKGIFCKGEIVLIASLLSDVYVSPAQEIQIPSGFTCCWVLDDSTFILGHKLGFLVYYEPSESLNEYSE